MTKGTAIHQGDPLEALTFSWETLPDLARDRWEEAVAYDIAVEGRLANGRSDLSRVNAERESVTLETMEATREVCHEITANIRKALDSAKQMEFDAARKQLNAEAAFKKAESALEEAYGIAEMTVSDTWEQADEILARAQVAAEKESGQIIDQTKVQARKMLVQVKGIKAAAKKEGETFWLRTQVSRLEADCLEMLANAIGWVNQPQESLSEGGY